MLALPYLSLGVTSAPQAEGLQPSVVRARAIFLHALRYSASARARCRSACHSLCSYDFLSAGGAVCLLSVCLWVGLHADLLVCLSDCQLVILSVTGSVRWCVCRPPFLSVCSCDCLSGRLSVVCASVCRLARLCVCVYVSLSVCLLDSQRQAPVLHHTR